MKKIIERASEIGFCFGVRRAINLLENAVEKYGNIDTLGAVVHNEQVTERLSKIGIRSINDINDIKSSVVAISSHGISPEIEKILRDSELTVLDTTCPFVRRAQVAARRLSETGFITIVFGDSKHPEVKGILGWANGNGIATLTADSIVKFNIKTRRLGILSQTTQIPEQFVEFSKNILEIALNKDSEIRVIDTICHDIRKRQLISQDLAGKVDLMLVIGGKASANTKRLMELCSERTETHQIEIPEQIDPVWLKNPVKIGVTSGTSTSLETIEDVISYLNNFDSRQ